MKHFFCIIVFILTGSYCSAQSISCYTDTRSKGVRLYSQKKYADAINVFEAARDCPDKPASDDLSAQIEKCREAIRAAATDRQRAQDERDRRTREESARRTQESDAHARKGYMEISKMEFGNSQNATIIDVHGATLYATKMKYLSPKIYYRGLATKSISVNIKIFDPDGTLSTGSSSPAGYTYSEAINVQYGDDKFMLLSGWGNENGGTYKPGTYRFEVWYRDRKLYERAVTFYKQAGEASKLTVNTYTALITNFGAEADTETYSVSTDADSYETWGVPSWCSIVSKSATSFTLRCEKNTSTEERKDYMKVNAGGKSVKIDIVQAGNKNTRSAKIESVWAEHNYWQGGAKGMLIHAKFTIDGMLERKGMCAAYFCFENGDLLKDFNGSYNSADGKVSVGENFTPRYVSAQFNDFKLFMPYTELHMNSDTKNATLKFYLLIYDTATQEDLARSDFVSFTFSY